MSREGALWIGGLEPYMDEEFLLKAFLAMGNYIATSVRIIKNRMTGEPANYGFVNFATDQDALMAMHKLNGKVIPNTSPPVRFKLNHSSTRLMPGERDHSIWVGDLSLDVDDLQLYKYFAVRFQSVRSAKVVLDQSGTSKGYGFVRFTSEEEQQAALATMASATGLGSRQIKVSHAMPKAKLNSMHSSGNYPRDVQPPSAAAPAVDPSSADYSQYYAQYWSQYSAWSNYSQYYDPSSQAYYGQDSAASVHSAPFPGEDQPQMQQPIQSPPQPSSGQPKENGEGHIFKDSIFDGDDFEFVDHSPKLDYKMINEKYLSRKEELWDSIREAANFPIDS